MGTRGRPLALGIVIALVAAVWSIAAIRQEDVATGGEFVPTTAAEGWTVVYRYPRAGSALSGIDAGSRSDVWVVGGAMRPRRSEVVLVRWDGTRWRTTPSWQPATGYATLHDVEALAPGRAWSVGRAPNGALVLRWNGARWERVAVPDGGTHDAELRGLDRVRGARALWAVGSSRGKALILRGNAGAWARLPVPDLPNSALFDVASVSRGTAFAVGEARGSTLILRWRRGHGWREVTDPVYTDARLEGVAAVGGTVVAVGYRNGPLLLERTADGWREVPWEWAGETFFLTGVTGRLDRSGNATFWVVGSRYLADGRIRPFVLRGRSGRWAAMKVPSPGPFSGLSAVTASSGWVWATGHDGEGESVTGLVMRGPTTLTTSPDRVTVSSVG
jgi:hypothetical protein